MTDNKYKLFLLFSPLSSTPLDYSFCCFCWSLSSDLFHQLFLFFPFSHLSFSDISSFFCSSYIPLFVLLFLFWFLLLPSPVINSRPLSFHSLVSTNLLCFFPFWFFTSSSSSHFCKSSRASASSKKLKLWKSLGCVLYFILSFSFSLCCTWKGSGSWNASQHYHDFQRLNIWDNVTPTVLGSDQSSRMFSHWQLKPWREIISFYRLKKILFTQSMFLIALWLMRFTSSLRIGREPSYNLKSTINLGKKAVPHWVLRSGGLSRCYSMLDPNPTKTHPSTTVYFCCHAGL